MPVRIGDPEAAGVNPFRRLSASQVNTWKSCNRLWYYTYIERLKSPLPPQIIRGNAAEECVCRVLRDSPVMISADSPDEMKSPLLDDGSLDYDNQMAWPSPAMLELPEGQWPDDRKALESWAMSRVDVHF
ncbi:MAG: PD-(D/E)XK nuclease family protein, partial [Candidatus Poseidoniales archaeon]|nr:PD-(D/E)XK nuclease family protein [Candidatus Poseidoniales archaeon]